jgi:hypothetical protein
MINFPCRMECRIKSGNDECNKGSGTPTDAFVSLSAPAGAVRATDGLACANPPLRARSPVGVPPRRLLQRTNAAAQLQNALPGTRRKMGVTRFCLSQSSDQVADRSSCRPGVFPEPPGSGGDEPPPAGTALAPPAGVAGWRPSRERDVVIRNANSDECQEECHRNGDALLRLAVPPRTPARPPALASRAAAVDRPPAGEGDNSLYRLALRCPQ